MIKCPIFTHKSNYSRETNRENYLVRKINMIKPALAPESTIVHTGICLFKAQKGETI